MKPVRMGMAEALRAEREAKAEARAAYALGCTDKARTWLRIADEAHAAVLVNARFAALRLQLRGES